MIKGDVFRPTEDKSKDPALPNRKALSFGLMQAARRGAISTASPVAQHPASTLAPKGSSLVNNQLNGTDRTPVNSQVAVAHPTPAERSVIKLRVEAPVSKPVVSIGAHDQSALAEDRSKINSSSSITASFAKQDLIITASAAKALTKLFSALALEPGSGNEVPVGIREKVLSNLIKESHLLADRLSRVVAGESAQPSIYLRARMLQQAVEYISDQWILHGELNTNHLFDVACAAFKGEVPGLNQEVVDLFHRAGEYTPADTQEISEARITEAVIRASWKLTEIVKGFDRADYDVSLVRDKGRGLYPFSYARAVPDVVRDLTHTVLAITSENKLQINALDIATTWTQNSIDRAATLVGAEYKLFADRSLRASFLNDLTSEASLGEKCQQYDTIMQSIHRRARNNFIVIEKNALEVMSAKGYKRFMPKHGVAPILSPAPESGQATKQTELSNSSVPSPVKSAALTANQFSVQHLPNAPTAELSPQETPNDQSTVSQPERRRFAFSRHV